MGIEDYVESEVAVAVAATAAAFSPRARETLRRGAVYGVAGVLKAGDVVGAAVRGANRGLRGGDESSSNGRASSRSQGGSSRTRSRSAGSSSA